MKPKFNLTPTNRFFIGALPLLLPAMLAPLATAGPALWTGASNTTWPNDANWNPMSFPGVSDNTTAPTSTNTDLATFDIAAGGVVNYSLSDHLNVGSVLFTGTPGSFTIQSGETGSGTKRLYFTVGGSVTMVSTVATPQTFARTGFSGTTGTYTFENNATLPSAILNMSSTLACNTSGNTQLILTGTNDGLNVIGNAISETGTGALSLTKNGTGTWVISSNGSYDGTTTINAGILGLGGSGAMGSSVLTINGGALASAGASTRSPTNNIVVGGDFGLGGLNLPINVNGTVNLGGATRTLTLGNSATINGVVSNGGLTLASTSADRSLTLSTTNTYNGATTVSGGALVVDGSISSATTVQSGALLGGNGSVVGAVALESGGGLRSRITDWTGVAGVGYKDLSVNSLSVGSMPINLQIDTTGLTNFTESAKSFTILNSTGALTFTPTSVNVTTTNFPGTGTWTLAKSGSSLVLSYAVSAADPFQTWVTGPPYNLAGNDALPTSDPDFDGINNSVEFVIGGNPANVSNTNLLPTSVVTGGNLVFTYRISDDSAYLNPTVQYGSNLTGWTTAQNMENGVTIGAPTPVVPAEAGIKQIVVTIPTSLGAAGKLFARLVVVVP